MDPRLLAFEAARRQLVDGDATAAARDLAHAFGAVHPQTSTLRAIQAVIDQLDNPSSFARNKDSYEKHGASQGTFNKWKKKLEDQKSYKGDQEGDLKERENEMQHNLELITSIA